MAAFATLFFFARRLALPVAAALLCACGQTGPLYLPESQPQPQAEQRVPDPADKPGANKADHH